MTRKEIIQKVEDNIEWLMNEGGINEREDVLPCAVYNFIDMYKHDDINQEELIYALDYLECDYDINLINEDKKKYQIQREKRKNRKKNKMKRG